MEIVTGLIWLRTGRSCGLSASIKFEEFFDYVRTC